MIKRIDSLGELLTREHQKSIKDTNDKILNIAADVCLLKSGDKIEGLRKEYDMKLDAYTV
jgi:hypothetical protein